MPQDDPAALGDHLQEPPRQGLQPDRQAEGRDGDAVVGGAAPLERRGGPGVPTMPKAAPSLPGRLRPVRAPLIVLLLSLMATLGVWSWVRHTVQERDRLRFGAAVAEAEAAITQRMDTYINALRDTSGLFVVDDDISRAEWRAYVQSLEVPRRYPGIQGLGFTVRIPRAELAEHERRVRAEGFPRYWVWPDTPREDYFSILFLEPFDWRNQRAFGFDMFSEPTRRVAMARARDTGRAAMSGRVTLVQETKANPQAGFLIYVPVYDRGRSLRTVADRRAALEGFVYSPFRADDLFRGILGRQEANPLLDVEIFDGKGVAPAARMHDHNPRYGPSGQAGERPRFVEVRTLTFAGRPWTIRYSALPAFEQASNHELPLIVLGSGILVSCLLFAITWTLATGRERAIAMAEDMTGELRQADRAKDEFLSVISHELRTPLNFIMGFASILDDEVAGPMTPQQHAFMGKILNGVDRMLLLVNDLLDFAKMQAGKLDMSRTPTPFGPLVDEVVATLTPLADQKALSLTSDVAVDVTPRLDGQRIVQVLTNLVGNAIKFTPQGGRIHVTARAEGPWLRTEVTDTGIGIAPEDIPKLFTRFRQLDMSSTRQAGGTGLGLSISKAIVEAHGGHIGVRSRKGEGSTFWFVLPVD